jgi:hypothetical protein
LAENFELRIALSIMQNPFSSSIVTDAKKTLVFALENLNEDQADLDHQIARDPVISE